MYVHSLHYVHKLARITGQKHTYKKKAFKHLSILFLKHVSTYLTPRFARASVYIPWWAIPPNPRRAQVHDLLGVDGGTGETVLFTLSSRLLSLDSISVIKMYIYNRIVLPKPCHVCA
jgi:hypothetical protein